MSESVHFKLTHNGDTRRFVFSRSTDEFLFLAVRLKALSITGPLTDREQFVWKDANTTNHPLKTIDDLTKAIKDAKYVNERFEIAREMPPCVHLEVVTTTTAAEKEKEVSAEEEAAIAAVLSMFQTTSIKQTEDVTIVLPDMSDLSESQQQLMNAYHERLQKKLFDYQEEQRQAVIHYEEYLRKNEEEYVEQQEKELRDYEQLLLRNYNENQRRWKSYQAVQTSHTQSTRRNASTYLERLLQQRQDLIRTQQRLMVEHLATFPPLKEDLDRRQRENLMTTVKNLQKALDDYKVQLLQMSETKKKSAGYKMRGSTVYRNRAGKKSFTSTKSSSPASNKK